MLTIPLQPAPKALPATTSPTKTSAGEGEALPFGALLKALQQQLQKDQETNPLALAALAPTVQSQPALLPESQPAEGQTVKSIAGKMSTAGPLPAKTAAAQSTPQPTQLADTNAALAVFPASQTESAPQTSPAAAPAENQPTPTSATVQTAAISTTSVSLLTTFRIPESLRANQAVSTASPTPANIAETAQPTDARPAGAKSVRAPVDLVPMKAAHKADSALKTAQTTGNTPTTGDVGVQQAAEIAQEADFAPETAQVTGNTPTAEDVGVQQAAEIAQEADFAPETAQVTGNTPTSRDVGVQQAAGIAQKADSAPETAQVTGNIPTAGDVGVQRAAEKADSAPEAAQITGNAPISSDVGGQKTVAGANGEVLPFVAQDQVVATAQAGKSETRPGRIQSKSEKSARTEKSAEAEARAGNLAVAANPLKEAATFKVEGKEFPIRSQQTEVVEQIARQLNAKIQSGTTTLRLELHPQDLGAIDVQMVSSPKGVSVTFFAEQPATGRLLEAQMGQLRQSLGEAGVQLAGLNIGQRGQEGGAFQQNTFAQPRNIAPVETAPMEPVAAQVTRPTDGIDYLI